LAACSSGGGDQAIALAAHSAANAYWYRPGMPRRRQLLTTDGRTLNSLAVLTVPPSASIASLSVTDEFDMAA